MLWLKLYSGDCCDIKLKMRQLLVGILHVGLHISLSFSQVILPLSLFVSTVEGVAMNKLYWN